MKESGPLGFIDDYTPLRIEEIVKITEKESDDEEFSEVEDHNYMSDDSDAEFKNLFIYILLQ